MGAMQLRFLLLLVVSLFFICSNTIVLADDDRKGERGWLERIFDRDDDDSDDEDNDDEYLPEVNNATYITECGPCHFVYQPGLLPTGSWKDILASLEDHNGEALEIDQESLSSITDYMLANSAEKSSAKRSRKIVKSLRGQIPTRITDIPYIIEKHDEISGEIFTRPSIGSRSNCPACHKTADKGIYEDDYANIPR